MSSHAFRDWSLGKLETSVQGLLERWTSSNVVRRLWARDPTIWFSEPRAELTDRLGWLSLPETSRSDLDAMSALARELVAEGVKEVILLGMGGSSLAPEVFQAVLGRAPGHPTLRVLDTTHPGAVRALEAQLDLRHAVFIVASKSGTTQESLSLFRIFWQRLQGLVPAPGRHFLAITDPKTPLERLASERGFRRTFLAPPDVGGRYSALSVFGLLPLALIGGDGARLLDAARRCAAENGPNVPAGPALALGAALGALALAGRDKVTFVTSEALAGFPDWIEQLIAESTGKEGKGIVPVVGEPLGQPAVYGGDRFFVSLSLEGEAEPALGDLAAAGHPVARFRLADRYDLGAEILRWEMAVALAGAALGIHPFDQPDVQLAKDLARNAMAKRDASASAQASRVAESQSAAQTWLASVRPGDYIGLQAYLAPTEQTTEALRRIRLTLRDRFRVATTFGYGPRFLHSTGQLHKGGPNTGVFLQLVDEPPEDVPVPETDFTLRALIRAQAQGDHDALRQRQRRVLRLSLGSDAADGLRTLSRILS
jgi:transaldolase/glucose-6-phosphate isomerase